MAKDLREQQDTDAGRIPAAGTGKLDDTKRQDAVTEPEEIDLDEVDLDLDDDDLDVDDDEDDIDAEPDAV